MFRLMLRCLLVVVIVLTASIGLVRTAPNAGVVGDGTPGSCTEAALNTALAGGGVVTFNCGGPKTILILSPKTIAQNTTIVGGDVITLTGGLTTRLFVVNGGTTLVLQHIILDSAFSNGSNGGAISNNGTLYLENSMIQNSQTDNNHNGGAIFSAGPVFINNSTLKKNKAGSAGALFINSGDTSAQISNSIFSENQAQNTTTGYGGAIWVGAQAQLTFTDSTLLGNSANFGGGLYVSPNAVVTLTASGAPLFLSANFAQNSGGVLYNEAGSLKISRANFVGNGAMMNIPDMGYGGAIANLGDMTLVDSSFSFNTGRFGASVFVGGSVTEAHATIERTNFSENLTEQLGGGLYTNGNTTIVTVTNSVFDGNTATSGGGVARFNARLDISNSSFTDNLATGDGGGLWSSTGSTTDPTFVSVTSVTFSGNTASSNHGGGIYNQGYSVLKNVTLKNNTNGIYNAGTTHLSNSVLDNPGSLNCDGTGTPILANGHNLSTDNSCALEQNAIAAQLGPRTTNDIVYNRTAYHLPLADSPLIDAGDNCPERDQRGALRPDQCDIGAVEFGGLLPRVYLPLVQK